MNSVLFILHAVAAQTLHSWSPIQAGPDSPFRFVVKIFKANHFLCLGALYQEDLVITTATHIRLSKTLYTVQVPISNTTHLNYVPFSVAGIEIHEANQNIPFTPKSDLALIKLKRETTYPTGLLLDYSKLGAKTGHPMFMVGWASEEIEFEIVDIAVQLNLPVHDPDDCARLNKGKWDPHVELCAGHPKVNHDAFYFLNGSPLFYLSNGGYYLVGLYSWGERDQDHYFPSVFTRISSFSSWIDTKAATYQQHKH